MIKLTSAISSLTLIKSSLGYHFQHWLSSGVGLETSAVNIFGFLLINQEDQLCIYYSNFVFLSGVDALGNYFCWLEITGPSWRCSDFRQRLVRFSLRLSSRTRLHSWAVIPLLICKNMILLAVHLWVHAVKLFPVVKKRFFEVCICGRWFWEPCDVHSWPF